MTTSKRPGMTPKKEIIKKSTIALVDTDSICRNRNTDSRPWRVGAGSSFGSNLVFAVASIASWPFYSAHQSHTAWHLLILSSFPSTYLRLSTSSLYNYFCPLHHIL